MRCCTGMLTCVHMRSMYMCIGGVGVVQIILWWGRCQGTARPETAAAMTGSSTTAQVSAKPQHRHASRDMLEVPAQEGGGRGKGRCVAHAAVRLTCSQLLSTADIYNAVAFTGHPGVPPTYTYRHQALLSTNEGSTRVAIVGAGPGHSIIDGQGGQHLQPISRATLATHLSCGNQLD